MKYVKVRPKPPLQINCDLGRNMKYAKVYFRWSYRTRRRGLTAKTPRQFRSSDPKSIGDSEYMFQWFGNYFPLRPCFTPLRSQHIPCVETGAGLLSVGSPDVGLRFLRDIHTYKYVVFSVSCIVSHQHLVKLHNSQRQGAVCDPPTIPACMFSSHHLGLASARFVSPVN